MDGRFNLDVAAITNWVYPRVNFVATVSGEKKPLVE
jgi:hypothetical protein